MHPRTHHFLARFQARADADLIAFDRADLHRLGIHRHAGLVQQPHHGLTRFFFQGTRCLLYTSDAADE